MKAKITKSAIIALVFTCAFSTNIFAQTHFIPPAGNPYSPMNIFLVSASYNEKNMVANDEIAVFDGDKLVGAAVFRTEVGPTSPLGIIAAKDDGSGNGFIDGHPILFKYWDFATQQEHNISQEEVTFLDLQSASPISPVPFSAQGTAAVSIHGKSASAVETSSALKNNIADRYILQQNFPNPFNPSTKILYVLAEPTKVRLEIYDLKGNLVDTLFSGQRSAGQYVVEWNGRNSLGQKVASGVYVYKLTCRNFVQSKKMILSK